MVSPQSLSPRTLANLRHPPSAAIWIAAKFEDAKDRVPTVNELVMACNNAYEESAFIQMEGHVLQTIGWILGHPTAEAWLRLAAIGNGIEDVRIQHTARFLMETTLFHRFYVACKPSDIAIAGLLLARHLHGKSYDVSLCYSVVAFGGFI